MNWKITDHCENTKEIHIEIWVSLFFRDLIRWTETGGLYEEQI